MSENSSETNQSVSFQTCCYGNESDQFNRPCCNDELKDVTFDLTMSTSILFAVNIAIAFTSYFLNSSLLWAISKVERTTLRAKHVIQSLSVANLFLPLIMACNPIFILDVVNSVLGSISLEIEFCSISVHCLLLSVFFLIQPSCAVILSLDRAYSFAKPMTYSIKGYPKLVRVLALMLPWVTAVVVVVGFQISTLNSNIFQIEGIPKLCVHMWTGYENMETANIIDYSLVITNTTVFLAAIVIFLIFKCHQKNTVRSTNVQGGLSMAVTYFWINCITLALYLPAPLYSISVGGALGQQATQHSVTTELIFLSIYLLNTCIDPLILIYRIRSIRTNLPCKLTKWK